MRKRPKKVLVVGAGAREHALVWHLAQSPEVEEVWACPGNPGMAEMARIVGDGGPSAVVDLARREEALVVIGPENPLAEGLADALRAAGVLTVGPGRAGAKLEASKRFAKAVMQELGIPTAASTAVTSPEDWERAIAETPHWPMVAKQSGLAQGKGVRIVWDPDQARALLAEWRRTPEALGEGILWEEYLPGREVSVQVLTNGREYTWLPAAVDHKRLTSDPASPNTGGMGAYAPVPWLDEAMKAAIDAEILQPLIQYIAQRQIDYRGVLYAGLMITDTGPRVLEFNVRFGDPEAEVVLPLIAEDLFPWLVAIAAGEACPSAIRIRPGAAVAVVVASEGYPASPQVGRPVAIRERVPDALLFHAGTSLGPKGLISRGGRVLTAVGLGQDFASARERAYRQVAAIGLEGAQVRSDIASGL